MGAGQHDLHPPFGDGPQASCLSFGRGGQERGLGELLLGGVTGGCWVQVAKQRWAGLTLPGRSRRIRGPEEPAKLP